MRRRTARTVLTRTRCVGAQRAGGDWQRALGRARRHDARRARARRWSTPPARGSSAVPAGGRTPAGGHAALRLVKGSHIVVPRLFEHDHAYIFQNPDQRIIFAIPYEHDFTLIGTTDVDYHGDPARSRIDADEIAYLCELDQPLLPAADHAGRRASGPTRACARCSRTKSRRPVGVTRDYSLELDAPTGGAAAVGVRRQDHDLPQARGRSRRHARAGLATMVRPRGPSGRRCPAAIFRTPTSSAS